MLITEQESNRAQKIKKIMWISPISLKAEPSTASPFMLDALLLMEKKVENPFVFSITMELQDVNRQN
jgi:hypothetical protein